MFIKLAFSFFVVFFLADANGSPFGSGLFDVVKKPTEIAKDTIQQPLQPILGAFAAPLKRQSRAAQSNSSSGSPSGLFDFVKKPAEVIKDAFEKPFQPILSAFGAPSSRTSRASDDSSDSKKKDDEENKDDDKKGDDKNNDDKKEGGKLPFQPIFDIFGSQVDRVSGAFSALLSPSSSNKQ